MIRTHIIPQSNHVQVIIPDNYIGKRLEVIVFADDDTQEMQSKTGNISKYKGALKSNDEQYKDIQQYLKDIRNEWNRKI